MLPNRSLLIGQKLVENAKIKTFKCDILSNFQTMCKGVKSSEMQLIQTSRVARTYFDAFSHLMRYRISTRSRNWHLKVYQWYLKREYVHIGEKTVSWEPLKEERLDVLCNTAAVWMDAICKVYLLRTYHIWASFWPKQICMIGILFSIYFSSIFLRTKEFMATNDVSKTP